jgi:hypothetical protein
MILMAKSKARKQREHQARQGKWNVERDRGSWNGINPVSKSTPTLKEKQERSERKYKKVIRELCG